MLAGLALQGIGGGSFESKSLPSMRNYGVYSGRVSGVAAAKRKAKKLKNIRRQHG